MKNVERRGESEQFVREEADGNRCDETKGAQSRVSYDILLTRNSSINWERRSVRESKKIALLSAILLKVSS